MQGQGLSAWLVQRITAVYLAVFVVVVALAWLIAPPLDYAQWRAVIANPWINIAVGLFYVALLLHAWVGGRDVAIDYVPNLALRLVVFAGLAFGLVALLVWIGSILIRVIAL